GVLTQAFYPATLCRFCMRERSGGPEEAWMNEVDAGSGSAKPSCRASIHMHRLGGSFKLCETADARPAAKSLRSRTRHVQSFERGERVNQFPAASSLRRSHGEREHPYQPRG